MNLLLDTHIYIWCLEDNKKLKNQAKNLIIDADVVYVSMLSTWEIAIKTGLGKLTIDAKKMMSGIELNGFKELPLTNTHILQLETLPLHHRDPFDRMLIAQAISEPLIFLTADKNLQHYSDLVRLV